MGNLSKKTLKVFEDSDLSGIDGLTFDQSKSKTNLINFPGKAIPRTGRETVIFDNLEFSRIFMAWSIPNLNDQKKMIGFEILASILSVGRNSRLVKVLKEEKDIVESVYVDVNAGELGGLLIIETCCEKKDLRCVENTINEIIEQTLQFEKLTIDEIRKAINIVKSNYIFNLETSTQLSSFLEMNFMG